MSRKPAGEERTGGGALEWLVAVGLLLMVGGGGWFAYKTFGPGGSRSLFGKASNSGGTAAGGAPATGSNAAGTGATGQVASTTPGPSGAGAPELSPEANTASPAAGPGSAGVAGGSPAGVTVPGASAPAAVGLAEAGVPMAAVPSSGEAPLPHVVVEAPTPIALPKHDFRFEELPAPTLNPAWPVNDVRLPESTDGVELKDWPVEVVPARLLVQLWPDSTEGEFLVEAAKLASRPKVAGRIPSLRLLVLDVNTPDLPGLREQWKRLSTVRSALYDEVLQAAGADPAIANLDAFDDWHLRSLDLPVAWTRTVSTPATSIAILDGPVQADHPELKGKVVPAWSLISGSTTISGAPDAHATAMAILAAGRIDNDFGAAGAAPGARLLNLEVARGGRTVASVLLAGVDRALALGSGVILAPYEPKMTGPVLDAYRQEQGRQGAMDRLQVWRREEMALAMSLGDRLVDAGAILVVPAGNRMIPTDVWAWAWADGVLAVAGSDGEGRQAAESSGGALVRLAAPGAGVPISRNPAEPASTEPMSGTSVAAALTAGVYTLARDVAPGLSAMRARELFYQEGRPQPGVAVAPAAQDSPSWHQMRSRLAKSRDASAGATPTTAAAETPGAGSTVGPTARVIQAGKTIEALFRFPALCRGKATQRQPGLAEALLQDLTNTPAMALKEQWQLESAQLGETDASSLGSFEEWQRRRGELKQEYEALAVEPGTDAELLAAVEGAVGELGARGTAVQGSSVSQAEALLIHTQEGRPLGAGLLRSGTWTLLFSCGTKVCVVAGTTRFEGRRPRRDVRAFELDLKTLAPLSRVEFREPLLELGPGALRNIIRRDRFPNGVGEAVGAAGVIPRGLAAALRAGPTAQWPGKDGRPVEFRTGGREVLRFELNGSAAELPVLLVDAIGRGKGRDAAPGPVLRYVVLDDEKWPVVVALVDPQRAAAIKPQAMYALQCQ